MRRPSSSPRGTATNAVPSTVTGAADAVPPGGAGGAAGGHGSGAAAETTKIIRPAAVLPDSAARAVLAELGRQDVSRGGRWNATPGLWQRYDEPWSGALGGMGASRLVGTIAAVYGTPRKHEITIYRATVTAHGVAIGWTVESLCDDALRHGGLSLDSCPRAALVSPPVPDPFRRGVGHG